MLCGLYSPTSGTAVIQGESISENFNEVCQSLGVCPQHDVLVENMSVKEHLTMFAAIKGAVGANSDDIAIEVDKMLHSVGLADCQDEWAKNLSSGQKRKLSVAIAFIGNSKVIILDEPTSGEMIFLHR